MIKVLFITVIEIAALMLWAFLIFIYYLWMTAPKDYILSSDFTAIIIFSISFALLLSLFKNLLLT